MTVLLRPLLSLALLSTTFLSIAQATRSVQAAPNRYAVVIVLDGARADSLRLTPMPNLHALMRRGTVYTRAFVGQLIANTPPSHATIGTGLFPKHHGVEGFIWEDPRTHFMTDPTQTGAVESGALEQVIRAHHAPSIASQVKQVRPHARIVSVSAHKCYAADAMATSAADYILCALIYHNRWVAQAVGNHRPPSGAINNPRWDVPIPPRTAGFGPAVQQWWKGTENRWITNYALWAFHRVHYPRVLLINLSETDVLGHFAPNRGIIAFLMQEFDRLLGRIETAYRKAGILDNTDFLITADHGMSRIWSALPYSVLSGAVSSAGATPVYIEHDTAVAIGIREDSKAHAVALNLFRLGGRRVDATYYKMRSHGRWEYRLAAAQAHVAASVSSAYLTLANTAASDASADILGVLAPHVSSRNFEAYGYPWMAGHLGPQWGDQHIPLILAGPGVRSGYTSRYPARLVDVAPTVEHLLGAPSGRVDGIVLQDALEDPSATGLSAQQRRRSAVLSPLIQALQRRAAAP